MPEKFILSAADYAIFIILLTVSTSIGLIFLIFDGKQNRNDDYFLAGKDMSILPVSFSLMASFLSATTILGIPAEMYLYGTDMVFMNLGFILGPIIASVFFLPIYFKTGVSTSYEYLERRFGKTTRKILSVIFLIELILYNGVSLYAPSLALSAVTNLSLWTSVICIGVVCTFYCALGGMKAVIWTDVIQAIFMFACLIAIIIKGCLDLGGVQSIFKTAYDSERMRLPTIKLDFSERYTIWSILLQGIILAGCSYSEEQVQVQRQLTLKNLKRSQIATLLSIPMLVAFQVLCCFCGLIIYAYFRSCDPVTSPDHAIYSYDQLMPYYVTSVLKEYPGLPGLCIAGIFSASLSTISSAVNSMAYVTSEDIIRPFWTNLKNPVLLTKVASVFYGTLTILVTFLIASLGNLIQSSILVLGMITGPTFAVFLLAAFTTTANETGVNIGVLAGFLLAGFMTFIPNEKNYPILPLNNCSEDYITVYNSSARRSDNYVSADISNFSVTEESPSRSIPDKFSMSFMWISPLSLLVCFVTGYIGSWIISYTRGTSNYIQPELLSPIRQWFYTNNLHATDSSTREKFLKDTTDTSL